jgi:hypothetical protein
MDLFAIAQVFLEILEKVEKERFFFSGKRKIFSQKEIFEAFLQDFQISPNFLIFFQFFIQAGDECDFFLIETCLASLRIVLADRKKHWFLIVSEIQKILKSLPAQIQRTKKKVQLELETLKNCLKSMFLGNCFGYDKENVDFVIIEAFITALGCYSGKSLENCLAFEWVKDFYPGPALFLLPGLVVTFKGLDSGVYKTVHFNER